MQVVGMSNWPQSTPVKVPFFDVGVNAGLPGYVGEPFEEHINIQQELVQHPGQTFVVRVAGQSMVGAGIESGDLLVVDKSITPQNNQIVLAVVDGEYTVKRLVKKNNQVYLKPENPDFPLISIPEYSDFRIWGVVTGVIKKLA